MAGPGLLRDVHGNPVHLGQTIDPPSQMVGGMGDDLPLSNALQGTVESIDTVSSEIVRAAEQMETIASQISTFLRDAQSEMLESIEAQQRSLTQMADELRESVQPSGPTAAVEDEDEQTQRERIRAEEQVREEVRESSQRKDPISGSSPLQPPPGVDPTPTLPRGHADPQEPENPYAFQRAVAGEQRYSIQGVRSDIGRFISTRAGADTAPEALGGLTDELTGMVSLNEEERAAIQPIMQEMGIEYNAFGELNETDALQIRNTLANRGVIRNLGSAIGAGKGISGVAGALGKGTSGLATVGRLAGGAGVALALGGQAVDMIQGQRETNNEYQRLTGGTNLDSFGDRLDARMFGMTQMFGMGSGKAQRLDMGATSIFGADDEMADYARSLGASFYNEFGMEVETSLQLIRKAANEGTGALAGLSSALRGVTDASIEAGISAEAGRAIFDQSFTQAANISSGAATPIMGQMLAELQIGLGTELGPGVNLAGVMTESNLDRMAAMTGMERNQLIASARTPGNTDILQGMQGQLLESYEISGLGRTEGLQEWMQEKIQARQDAGGELDQSFYSSLTTDALAQFGDSMDTRGLPAIVQGMTGIAVTDDTKALELLLRASSGGFDPAAIGERIAGENSFQEGVVSSRDRELLDTQGGQYALRTGQTRGAYDGVTSENEGDVPVFDAEAIISGTSGYEFEASNSGFAWGHGDDKRVNTERAYAELIGRTGASAPLIRQLVDLQQDTDVQVAVDDGSGNMRSMSLWEAIRAAPDQLQAGTAIMTSGNDAGRTVGEIFGTTSGPDPFGEDFEANATGESVSDIGETYERGEAASGGDVNATVTVRASPLLQQWLDFQGNGVRVAGFQGGATDPYGLPLNLEAAQQ